MENGKSVAHGHAVPNDVHEGDVHERDAHKPGVRDEEHEAQAPPEREHVLHARYVTWTAPDREFRPPDRVDKTQR